MEYHNWKKLIFHFHCNFNRMGFGLSGREVRNTSGVADWGDCPFCEHGHGFPILILPVAARERMFVQ